MAGIGFQLKKVFREQSILYGLKGYAYSSIVVVGPMLLCMLIIAGAQMLLVMVDTPPLERQLFLAATVYAFIFSQIVSSFFNLFISRYVADQLFINKKAGILSSLYGVTVICILLGSVVGFLFYVLSPLSLSFKILSFLFFIQLIIIWMQMIYISALRDYMRIIKGFLVATFECLALFFIFYKLLGYQSAVISLLCLNIGFFIMVVSFYQELKREFKVNNQQYFRFVSSTNQYPALIAVGFLYMMGLYGPNIIIWMGDLQEHIGQTFIIASYYDVPAFYASLSTLPALVLFVVSTETKFYEKYKTYFSTILGSFPYKDIKKAKNDMIQVLQYELTFMMEVQLVSTLISIMLGIQFLPRLGLTSDQLDIFTLLTIGNAFFILMYFIILLLLYFDDRKGTLLTISIYTISNLILTAILATIDKYGLSSLMTGAIGFTIALYRLSYYVKNLDYFTFCSQPLLYKEKRSMVDWVNEGRKRIWRKV